MVVKPSLRRYRAAMAYMRLETEEYRQQGYGKVPWMDNCGRIGFEDIAEKKALEDVRGRIPRYARERMERIGCLLWLALFILLLSIPVFLVLALLTGDEHYIFLGIGAGGVFFIPYALLRAVERAPLFWFMTKQEAQTWNAILTVESEERWRAKEAEKERSQQERMAKREADRVLLETFDAVDGKERYEGNQT